jgi:DNA mismatch repair protein MutS2
MIAFGYNKKDGRSVEHLMNPKILKLMDFEKVKQALAGQAQTSLGKQLAAELEPSSHYDTVLVWLKQTDEASVVERMKGAPPFGGIRDIRSSLHRAKIGGMLHAQELLDIATTISGGRLLKKYCVAFNAQQAIPLLIEKLEGLTDPKAVEQAINSCIDDNGAVMDQASPELNRIRHEIRTGESRIRDRMEQMIRNTNTQKMLQDAIVTMRNDRYVLPVKQEYRAHFGGLVHDQSSSGATLFIEPEAIVNLNNKLREFRMKEEREVERILRQLTEQVGEISEEMNYNVSLLGEMDFIFAKSGLARAWKATRPELNDRGYFRLRKARHPFIDADTVVPINVELGDSFRSIIVTGPNTGGKTVSLKTIGLLHLLVMSGLFVPAEENSELSVFDGIYADIGDEQSIEQNLSTFSSHLTNIISTLKAMTPKSLVLLDEVGAGTDPAEGSALAISILEHIHQMGCRMIATTHYSELKAYAYDREGIINASMEFDIQTLSPTYRLLIGVPGRSNAFAIAERLGLAKSIIDHAKGQVTEEDQRVDTMIASLEANRLSAEQERESAVQLRKEVEGLRGKLKSQQERFDQQKDKLLDKAEKDAKEALQKAKQEAEQIIADLRKMALEEQSSIKEHKLIEAKRRLDTVEPVLDKRSSQKTGKQKSAVVEAGDHVQVISLGQKGHVVELSGTNDVVVQLGIMKMKVKKSDIALLETSKDKQAQQMVTTIKRSKDDSNVRTELDLRGQNLEDSYLEVGQFLDEAFLSNLGQVYVIHGKGTGVLRNGIQQYLRKHKHVKSYRLGEFGEGGTGVTVVQLK